MVPTEVGELVRLGVPSTGVVVLTVVVTVMALGSVIYASEIKSVVTPEKFVREYVESSHMMTVLVNLRNIT